MNITETICYKEADGIELLADLCMPETQGPHPLLLYIHGGGWHAGRRVELQWFSGWADVLLAAGVAVASIEYRFCTEGRSYRAPVEDCADALRFFARNADRWALDPTRVVLGGISAGAHLSMMVAFAGEQFGEQTPFAPVRGVVALSGPTDFSRIRYTDPGMVPCMEAILSGKAPYDPEIMRAASPLTWLKRLPMQAYLPPILAIHGACDALVDPKQPVWIAEEYARRGGSFRLITVENATHVFAQAKPGSDPSMSFAEIQEEAANFTLERLCNR